MSRSWPKLRRVLAAATLLLPSAALAQGSLSGSIGDPLSGSIYSESDQNGPSSTLIPGDNSIQTPFQRSGISDPLSFLIETSDMSPYPAGQGFAFSAPSSGVQSQTLSDPLIAIHVSEYRSNRELMSGSSVLDTASGRQAFTGFSASAGGTAGRSAGSSASSFGGPSMLLSFSAGSHAASRGGGAASGGSSVNPNFIDPNALVTASASKGMRGSLGSSGRDNASPAASSPYELVGGLPPPIGSDALEGSSSTSAENQVAGDGSNLVQASASSIPVGPAPGGLFPVPDPGSGTGFGFEDSTMGTAGLPSQSPGFNASPLLSPMANAVAESPFRSLSGGSSTFLHPSLTAPGSASASISAPEHISSVDAHELARRARMRAMVTNPSAALPSAFEMRRMERAYGAQQHSSHSSRSSRPTFSSQSSQ